ncbi:MAG: molybdopterin-dependent oxidoreductase [Polyangiaceae bacterium]|nr:molybdopterin-dependent oxidoreductase [Polyangiaceae bacterium]
MTKKTICNRDCPDACSIVATIENDRVTRIAGDPDHPITQGFLCHRTSHFLSTQYSPERLTSPLIRKGRDFEPITWDQALDIAADRLVSIKKQYGPAAIFHYRSGGTLGILGALTDHFFGLFGPVTTKTGDICSGAGDYAQMTDFGEEDSHDIFDLYHSKNILLWGKNVFTSSPHTIPVLKEAKSRGASLVLIDPVFHKTASICDRFIQPKPGGDFALAMAVARLLFERGHIDPNAHSYCDHLADFQSLAVSKTVAQHCAEADVSPSEAEDLADRLGPGKPTAILVGWGMGRRYNGASIVRALDALSAVSGNIGILGGGASFYFKRRGAYDTSFKDAAIPPRTIREPLFAADIFNARDPEIKAMWITAGNPVVMLPDSDAVARAVETREFSVVADLFLTDTARRASLVLPVTTLLEADDLLGAYGHHYLGVATPVVAPPPGVRSDLQIMQGLAERVGLGPALAGSARDWKRRIIEPRLAPHGITLETLEQGAVKNPLSQPVLFADRTFKTPSGKVNLLTQAPPGEPSSSPDYPLYWTSISTERSQSSQWAKPQEGPLVVTVHPSAANGVADGALARVESPSASLTVRLKHDPKQRRDIALAPKGGHYDAGRAANALITARLTDFGEGAAIYDDRVRIVPV